MANQKPYTLFKRGKTWYVQFRAIDGERITPKSTGETSKARAEMWCIEYLQKGQGRIVKSELVTFESFSKGFFDWNGSWATDKKIRGLRISEYHCKQRTDLLNNHIIPAIGKIRLTSIDRAVIKDFRNNLYKKEYSGNTINKCLSVVKTILEAAEEQSLIQYIPRIDRAADNPKIKGVLTPGEVRQLLSFDWMSRSSQKHPARLLFIEQTGNLLAITTGLRISEIQGLTHGDINLKDNYITVKRSWNNALRVMNKETKTGKERIIFFSDKIKMHIVKLMSDNPHGETPESFLFYSDEHKDRPKDKRAFSVSLFLALEAIGIDEVERKKRNITFHSHRHFLNSLLINNKVPLQKVQNIVGHGTIEMSNHYYKIDEMSDVLQITDSLLGRED